MLILVFIGVPSAWVYGTVMAYVTPSGSRGGEIHRIRSGFDHYALDDLPDPGAADRPDGRCGLLAGSLGLAKIMDALLCVEWLVEAPGRFSAGWRG